MVLTENLKPALSGSLSHLVSMNSKKKIKTICERFHSVLSIEDPSGYISMQTDPSDPKKRGLRKCRL